MLLILRFGGRRSFCGVGERHDDGGRLGSHAATRVEGSSPWRGREAGKRRMRHGIHGALLQLDDEDTGAVPMAGAEAQCSGSVVSGRVAVAASGEGAERGRWRSAYTGDAAISWRSGGAPTGS